MKIREASLDLGAYEFAPGRIDLEPSERSESNTQDEKYMFDELEDWVNGNTQPTKRAVDMLVGAMNDPRYRRFFREPSVSQVYRGLNVRGDFLNSLMGSAAEDVLSVSSGSVEGDWVVRPLKQVISFSRSFDTAEHFSSGFTSPELGTHRVVLFARVSDNPGMFLDLYSIQKRTLGDYWDVNIDVEQEVIALGPVRCHKIAWIRNENYDADFSSVKPREKFRKNRK